MVTYLYNTSRKTHRAKLNCNTGEKLSSPTSPSPWARGTLGIRFCETACASKAVRTKRKEAECIDERQEQFRLTVTNLAIGTSSKHRCV